MRRRSCTRCWWLASTHTCWRSTRHPSPRSPLPTISFDLSQLSISISTRKVCNSTNKQDDVIMGAVQGICTAKWRTRWAIGPLSIRCAAEVRYEVTVDS